ncbi:unnamed protein product [Durusdinium trenchii]|uniref:Uncharacterized protein n=2 Tax=Durusdinium trenchii TaxID=1381693 RepID=A0ABP0RDG1_9DINO
MANVDGFSRIQSEQAKQQVDAALVTAVNDAIVAQAFKSAVQECKFCVTVANPHGEDFPLIAVSEEFETMTGYTRNEILGVNCRFLNQGVDMNPQDLIHLREASATGAPFTAILPNRKRSGELFLNLLDVRGLTVARNPKTGEDLWYLIGIQADVSELGEEQMPDEHFAELQMMSHFIREKIIKELSEYALSTETCEAEPGTFELLPTPEWRPGGRLGSRQFSAANCSRVTTKSNLETQSSVRVHWGSVQKAALFSAIGVSLVFLVFYRRALRPK